MSTKYPKEACIYETYRSPTVKRQKIPCLTMLIMVVGMVVQTTKLYTFATDDLKFTTATAFSSSQRYNNSTSATMPFTEEFDFYPFNPGSITFHDMETILSMKNTLAYLNAIEDQKMRRATKIYLFHCPYNDICNFSLGLGYPSEGFPCCGACRCDTDCKTEGSCCPNFVPDFDEIVRISKSELECQYPSLYKPQSGTRKDSGYYFVSYCPPQKNLEETEACRSSSDSYVVSEEFDFSNVIPVTSIRNGLNYINTFCASCHGVKNEDLQYWNVSLSCNNSFAFGTSLKQRIMEAIITKTCNLIFHPPKKLEDTLKKCTPSISSCNESGTWFQYDEVLEKLCHSPFGSSFDLDYKNVFCMICNNITKLNNRPVCVTNAGLGLDVDVSFSALLNFRRQELKPLESSQCPLEMVFDPYLMKCRQLYCSAIKTLDKNKCINVFSQLDVAFIETEITFFPLKKCSLTEANYVTEQINTWFGGLLFNLTDVEYNICYTDTVYKVNHVYDEDLLQEYDNTWYSEILSSDIIFIASRWKFKVTGFYEFDRIYQMIQNITNFSVILPSRENLSVTLLPRLIIFDQPVFDKVATLSEIYSEMSNTYFQAFPLEFNQMISHAFPSVSDSMTFIPYIVQNTRDDGCIKPNEKVNLTLSILIPCTMIELDPQRLDWNYTEYGVHVPKLDLHVNMTDFIVVPNPNGLALRICTQVYMASQAVKGKTLDRKVSFEANTILSVICTAMSLLCLMLTLIVYLVFPKLQTVPGKNNMLLVINLLIAQAMYLVFVFTPNPTVSICKTIGVLLHFFWLSAIFWMHMCTFHMLKVFIRMKKPNPKASSSSTVVIYEIIVVVLSTIFVLINIIKALVESDKVEMGYGPEICYISSGNMVGFTFALPVGFVVISNLAMFIIVIFKLRSLPNVEMNVKHDRNNTVIIVKLSSLTGITWIFGFLYVWTGEIVLSYFFIVLNASLGIFIMASFIVNKRVIELIRNAFSPKSAISSGSHLRDAVSNSTYAGSRSRDTVYHSTNVVNDLRDVINNSRDVGSNMEHATNI